LGGSPFDDYLSDSSLGDAPWDIKDDYEMEISKGEVEQTINSTSESTEMSFPDQPNLELVALHQHSSDGINVSDSTFNYTNATIEPSISERKQPANPTNSTNTIQTRISKDQLQDIKSSISIIDVIESYNLPNFVRTNSYTAKACCPFHDDHNPSMSIDENRGIYKCFACGAGGDLFNFIREYDALSGSKEKMGFMEAVQYAVKEFGGERVRGMDNFDTHQIRRWDENMSEEAKAKMVEREKKKER
jgi:DNA primase